MRPIQAVCLVCFLLVGASAEIGECVLDPSAPNSCREGTSLLQVKASLLQVKATERAQDEALAGTRAGKSRRRRAGKSRRRRPGKSRRRRPGKSQRRRAGPQHCAKTTHLGGNTVWKRFWNSPSCKGEYKDEGVGMCEGDPTSIVMDMKKVSNKQGCWAWKTDHCKWDANRLATLQFDADWSQCDHLWFAPLWFMSSPWIAPQGRSGEIDLIESCRGHPWTLKTSIICHDHPHPQCYDETWGEGSGAKGPKRFKATIDDGGTWRMEMCELDETGCKLVSRFPDFLNTVYPTKDGRNNGFHFVSDIWNGGDGDGGWRGCGNLNHHTQCWYAIANIKMTTKDGAPMYDDGVCTAFNGVAKDHGDCANNCHLEGSGDASCKSRVEWVMNNLHKNLQDSMEQVNGECGGQCSCTEETYKGKEPGDSASKR